MKRLYDYQCSTCREFSSELREMEDVYEIFFCAHCGAETPGREAKKIIKAVNVSFKQGRVKGLMNSGGR